MNSTKNFVSSFLISILWIICFYILFLLTFTILAFLFGLFASVPFIKSILQISLFTGSTTLDAVVYGTSGVVSFLILTAASALIKNERIQDASFVMFGTELIIMNIIFLIINIVIGNSVWINGEFIFIGIVSITTNIKN